jgi:hypothetical protein
MDGLSREIVTNMIAIQTRCCARDRETGEVWLQAGYVLFGTSKGPLQAAVDYEHDRRFTEHDPGTARGIPIEIS